MNDIERYNAERNSVLLTGDLQRFIAWANSNGVSFHDKLQAETTMHKTITAIPSLPLLMRQNSKNWLTQHRLHSLDDGDLKTEHQP